MRRELIRPPTTRAASIDVAASRLAAMVGVVQLVERQVVILNVAGSSPVTHPTGQRAFSPSDLFLSKGIATLAGNASAEAEGTFWCYRKRHCVGV
jgi:hypothetical protein